MNPPFPEAAEPVRQKIRELVERPKELPEQAHEGKLRWQGDCPYLLLPKEGHEALGESPRPFWRWWDSCTDPQEAVDTVWGEENPLIQQKRDEDECLQQMDDFVSKRLKELGEDS